MKTLTDILGTIRTATESHDARALIDLYADDARIEIVDRSSPPSAPTVHDGKEAVADYLRRGCAVQMSHVVSDQLTDGSRLAYTTRCRYPDGARVICATIADLNEDGRIARQTVVQAWDE